MVYLCNAIGGLAQLVRALAWHARGREFESHILHKLRRHQSSFFVVICDLHERPLFPSFPKGGQVECKYKYPRGYAGSNLISSTN